MSTKIRVPELPHAAVSKALEMLSKHAAVFNKDTKAYECKACGFTIPTVDNLTAADHDLYTEHQVKWLLTVVLELPAPSFEKVISGQVYELSLGDEDRPASLTIQVPEKAVLGLGLGAQAVVQLNPTYSTEEGSGESDE